MRRRLLAAGLAVALFGAGVGVGVFADRHLMPHGVIVQHGGLHTTPEEHLELFKSHLDLTDEQTAQIEAIMKRTRAEYESLRGEQAPRVHALHDRAQREILEVLSESQAAEYHRLIQHTRHGGGGH